jgi:hypothetical protein
LVGGVLLERDLIRGWRLVGRALLERDYCNNVYNTVHLSLFYEFFSSYCSVMVCWTVI